MWAPEEMHHIRRIYLTGGPTPDLKPSYLGEALGRWEGDTLVVETRGLRSLPAGAKLVERWQKNAEGNELAIDYGPVDARGAPLRAVRTLKLNWASGQQVLEWICEDYSDEWLPGGGEYRGHASRGPQFQIQDRGRQNRMEAVARLRRRPPRLHSNAGQYRCD